MPAHPPKPCPCIDCKGAIVSYRTLLRHRERPIWVPTPVMEYGDGTEDLCSSSEDSEDGLDEKRPSKRLREHSPVNTVSAQPNRNLQPHAQLGVQSSQPQDVETRSITSASDSESLQGAQDQSGIVQAPDALLDSESNIFFESQIGSSERDNMSEKAPSSEASDPESNSELRHNYHTGVSEEFHEAVTINLCSVDNVKRSQQMIDLISKATLDNTKLDDATRYRLRNPIEGPPDISDPDIRLSVDLFMACENASQRTYSAVRDAFLRHSPNINILTYKQVNDLVSAISGVVVIRDDMCINSCHAFTGPFADLESCYVCRESRYEPDVLASSGKKVSRKQACTIPLGPQIQALRRSKDSATAMRYRHTKTEEILGDLTVDSVYDDIFCGSDYLELHENLRLSDTDTTVMFSFDGAQLYKNKKSDTWIAIWIIADYDPTTRYKKKHVLPALIVPGPNKPKDLDSFLFQSFHHLSAIQRENNGSGIRVWDCLKNQTVSSRIINLLELADSLALADLVGTVGHHGAQGCRVGCAMKGRHKPGIGHYCAAHLRPNGAQEEDNIHPDYDFRNTTANQRQTVAVYNAKVAIVVASGLGPSEYTNNRKATGISKPTIVSGLDSRFTLPVPDCFTLDLMHLLSLNIGELLIPLWRAQLSCDKTDSKNTWDWAVLTGNTWSQFGQSVASATKYFPSSFHRPPRNPADKISSGYKATEYFVLLYGLGPGLLRPLLPGKYWRNFCKLVHGVRIIIQRKIKASQLREAYSFLIQFVEEYENLYYQRRMDRLHFCRPCLHALLHCAQETIRIGPGAYYSQFTMERTIGDMGQDIRQPSNIYGNLCQIALRRSQINALKAMCPDLDPTGINHLPAYSYDLQNGYIFLTPRQRRPEKLPEGHLIQSKLGISFVRKWGRVRLRNSQIARSVFCEDKKQATNTRITRNVKIIYNNTYRFGEVQYYFLFEDPIESTFQGYALILLYGPPDADLLEQSYHTLVACQYIGQESLSVIEITDIVSVVSMQPLPLRDGDQFLGQSWWFVIEKSGLDDTEMTGYVQDELEE